MFSDFECSIVWPEISPDNNFVQKSKGREANKVQNLRRLLSELHFKKKDLVHLYVYLSTLFH